MPFQFYPRRAVLGTFAVGLVLMLALAAGRAQASVDIGPMKWTPRSDWINVKDCTAHPGCVNAVGDGVTDDTAAIQSVLSYIQSHFPAVNHPTLSPITAYFPSGTYKISKTLSMGSWPDHDMLGVSLIGCGSSTIIKWADDAPIGPAMFAPDGTDEMRYLGFVWDGNNRAGCGIELNTTGKFGEIRYESQIRIENSSFRNFTQIGTYAPAANTQVIYGAGIAQGFGNTKSPTGESMVYNCRFSNCTIGVAATLAGYGNYYVWNVDGCEFDNCTYTGVYCQFAGGFMITNCHFQNTGGPDIFGENEARVRHCTSQGSGMFYTEADNIVNDPEIIEDCWVDSWKGWRTTINSSFFIPAGPAVNFAGLGPDWVFDSIFTHPPASAQGAVYPYNNPYATQAGQTQGLFLSNNTTPSGLSLLWPRPGVPLFKNFIPPGQRGGLVSSPSQTFLKTTWPADSIHILDVTQAPYTADRNFDDGVDSTATIQAAINAAAAANNGSIVYFPAGNYRVSSALTAPAGHYTLQGTGILSGINWKTASRSPVLVISNPQNITVQGLDIPSVLETVSGPKHGPTSAAYDELFCFGQGLTLSNLPAYSTVYLGHVDLPLTVSNCGAAQILSKYLQFTTINISGATRQTGFLGVMEGEGGQEAAGIYNITIGDNQDFVMDDYYTEQEANGLDLERGVGTGFGRVSISGLNSEVKTHSPVTSLLVNNYAGRLFYTSDQFGQDGPPGYPYSIRDTGTNPLDLIFAGNWFYDNGIRPFMPGPATTAIGLVNIGGGSLGATAKPGWASTTDNSQTAHALASEAAGLDHFRQLETAEAAHQAGLVGYWKLDEADGTVSRDSTISGLSGRRINGPKFTPARPASIAFTNPGSLALNGVSQYVSIPSAAMLPSGTLPRTLCGWAKSDSLADGYRCIAAYGSPSPGRAMFIGMHGKALWAGGFGSDLFVPGFWDNRWHFIALTYDGATARLYADGVLRASAEKAWDLTLGKCLIGEQVNGGARYWNGSVDDVRIYNRALSAADISSLAGH